MMKSEVPPNWTELVEKTSKQVTNKDYDLAKTWLFPDAESGDIAMQTNQRLTTKPTEFNNIALKAASNNTITVRQSGHQSHLDFSGSNNAQGISQEDSIQCLYLDSVNELVPQMQDKNSAPALINLETTGLRQPPRLAALQNTMALRLLQLTHRTTHHPLQGYFQSQDHNSCFYWSSTWLALCGHLPPQVLLPIMRPFPLWLDSRMTMINCMAYLMIQSMISVIKFMPTQLQTNLSRTHKC